MNKAANQELLSPASAPANESNLLRWLFSPAAGRYFLPATGLWILGLDWLLFSQDTLTLGLSTPLTAVLGFLAGALGTYKFQRSFAGDRGTPAGWKALLAGIIVGLPFPLAGTIVGGWIVATSGLTSVKNRLFRR